MALVFAVFAVVVAAFAAATAAAASVLAAVAAVLALFAAVVAEFAAVVAAFAAVAAAVASSDASWFLSWTSCTAYRFCLSDLLRSSAIRFEPSCHGTSCALVGVSRIIVSVDCVEGAAVNVICVSVVQL